MYRPKGIKEASDILSKSTRYLIYYDADIDGGISGDLVRRFLQAFNQPYMIYINENRTHGLKLTDQQIDSLVGYTIFLVDAAITRSEVRMLVDKGINVINIDHHHVNEDDFIYEHNEQTNCSGVVINNQYPFEPEDQRYLSGAGMVYYVINALSPNFCGQDEKALVGLSLLSDIRPIESEYARDFLHTTYTHKSPLMDYLLYTTKPQRDFGFGIQTFDRNFIDFTFSPKINALFRLNKGYDAIAIFEGKYQGGEQLDVFRNIQNTIRDMIIDNLQGETHSNLEFRYVNSNLPLPFNYDITNFIGLACSKMKNDGKTTLMFVKEDGKIKRGSVRGMSDDVDYLEIFRKHGFEAEGHKNAFGVKYVDFDKVDLVALNKEIATYEEGYAERKYNGRILPVGNLTFFLKSKNATIADHNNYVRDSSRIYLQYTGKVYETYKKGKATEYTIDGVKVMAFEEGLTPENGLILPVRERGHYINFYLKPY